MNVKEATRFVLMKKAKENGFNAAYSAAYSTLKSKEQKDNLQFTADVHGEICETVLELRILEFMSKNKEYTKDWRLVKGLILKDRHNLASDFMTETDLFLATPQCLYLFECKSYSGDKVLVKDGLLVRQLAHEVKPFYCNVYQQSMLHKNVISEWFTDEFLLPGRIPIIQTCMFDFSLGTLVDKRSRAAKIELPCLNINSLIPYLVSQTEEAWDMQALCAVVERLQAVSDKCRSSHLKYVKSLHGGV